MTDHYTTATLDADGTLTLDRLPFPPGQRVLVTVQAVTDQLGPHPRLAGSVLKYDHPFDPACDPDDWNALRDDGDHNL